jgi:hypothetical protein
VKKREVPSVSAAPMPDPARSTAKNKVLHITAIIKDLYRRIQKRRVSASFVDFEEIIRNKGKLRSRSVFSSFIDSLIKKTVKGF